jgi:hypothetical protein
MAAFIVLGFAAFVGMTATTLLFVAPPMIRGNALGIFRPFDSLIVQQSVVRVSLSDLANHALNKGL